MEILVAKYITGQADEQETVLVKEWISKSKENEDYYIQLYETWHDMLNAEPGLIDADHAYQLFLERTTAKKSLYRRMSSWKKVAAAAAVIAAITISFFYFRNTGSKEQVWTEVKVAEGSTRKLTLDDGSVIWVNAGSQLSYNTDFGESARTVHLEGEAYFDIAKSKNNIPFIIKTKDFTIRDIGTKFNLKAYADEPLEATVIEGKISVEGKLSKHNEENSKVLLEQKQVLKINSQPENNAEHVKVVTVDSSQLELYKGWTDNFLGFDEVSLKELAKIMERKYNVQIVIENKELENYKYTGSFRNVENITKIMEIIKATTPVTYRIEGRTVIISAANL